MAEQKRFLFLELDPKRVPYCNRDEESVDFQGYLKTER